MRMTHPTTYECAFVRQGTRLGAWLLTGSIFMDAMLWGVSAAKVFGVLGISLLFVTTLVVPRLRARELAFLALTWIVVLLNLCFYPTAYSKMLPHILFSFVLGSCLIVTLLMTSHLTFFSVLRYFVGWATVASMLGIVQALSGRLFLGDRVFVSGVISGTWRASGFCNDPNYFALLGLIALPVVLYRRRIEPGGWWTTRAVIIGVSIVFSGSRSGILFLPLAYTLSGLLLRRHLTSKAFYVLAVAIIGVPLVAATFNRLPGYMRAVFDSRSYDELSARNSLRERYRVTRAALAAAREHPVFGYGIGNVVNHPLNFYNILSHNTYLEILAETGAIGLALYSWLIIHFLKRLIRMSKLPDGNTASLAKCLTASFVAFLVMSGTLVTYYTRIWFFLAGVLFVAMRIGDRAARSPVAAPRSPAQPNGPPAARLKAA
jgi:O-antigen ligase